MDSLRRIIEQPLGEIVRRIAVLERQVEDMNTRNQSPAWTDWTPTVTQSGSVAVTVTEAKYCIIGAVCHIYALLTVTGTGTSGFTIVVQNLPFSILPYETAGLLSLGTAMIADAGSGVHSALAVGYFSTSFIFWDVNSGTWVGSSFALASGDLIQFSATYRIT